MRKSSSFAALVFMVILGIGGGLAYAMYGVTANAESAWIGVITFVVALVVSLAIKVADQWERVVILRLGKFRALKGPGLFFIIPVIDMIPYWIDTRVITASFKAEKTLTKDTVPVDVDAVLFWKVLDPKKAALDVADYQSAISWASQTALRDVIGKTMLSDMLEGREKISNELQKIIDERTEPWGINVISVEVKDVLIPSGLGGCDVDAGPGGKRTSGPRDSGRFRATGGGEVWRSGQDLCQQSGRPSFAGHEHAVRGFEGERHDRHRAQHGRGNHATGRSRRGNSADHGIGSGASEQRKGKRAQKTRMTAMTEGMVRERRFASLQISGRYAYNEPDE